MTPVKTSDLRNYFKNVIFTVDIKYQTIMPPFVKPCSLSDWFGETFDVKLMSFAVFHTFYFTSVL